MKSDQNRELRAGLVKLDKFLCELQHLDSLKRADIHRAEAISCMRNLRRCLGDVEIGRLASKEITLERATHDIKSLLFFLDLIESGSTASLPKEVTARDYLRKKQVVVQWLNVFETISG